MRDLLKRHSFIIALSIVFFGLAAAFICTWYQYQLNPDATAYISIAHKYAHGDFQHALNGYWGPLLSVLLVPFVWLHANPIVGAKLIAAAAGVGILVLTYQFLLARKVSRSIIHVSCFALATVMFEWATVEAVTPDMLLAFLITLFAVRLSAFLQRPTRNQGIILGLIGVLMYFTKGFGFFLFLGAVGFVALWQWWKVDKNLGVVIRRYLPLALAFAILAVPYVTAISIKYHQPTINNAGAYDHRAHGYYGAKTAADSPIINIAGPLVPPNSTALNAWEDPSLLTPLVPNWSPIDSRPHLKYFVQGTIGKNLNNIVRYVYAQGPLVMISMLVLLIGAWQRRWHQRDFAVFGLVTALMIVGYSLVLAEGRYLWGAIAMGAMAAALWFSQLEKRKLLNTAQILVGGLAIAGLGLLSTGQTMAQTKYNDREWAQISNQLRATLPKGSHIVSDNFERGYHVCYYLDLKCYNIMVPPTTHSDKYAQLLKKDGITYYLNFHIYGDEPTPAQFTQEYFTQVSDQTFGANRVTIYKLNR